MFKLTVHRLLLLLSLLDVVFMSSSSLGFSDKIYFNFPSTDPQKDMEIVPSIAILNLSRYTHNNGVISYAPELFLYVFYAKGTPSGLASGDVTLKKIKKVLKYEINKDTILIPPQEIEKEVGISNAYDLIVFVVSPFDNFQWKNSNGLPVEYSTHIESNGVSVHLATDYIRRDDMDRFLKSQDSLNEPYQNPIYAIPFARDN